MEQAAVNIHFRVRKGDTVKVITGKDKGKTGKVLEVNIGEGRIFVEKLNIQKRHTRPSQKHRQGGIIEREGPIHISNVMVVCRSCGKPARTGMRRLDDGQKLRVCKKCSEVIDKG